MRALVVPDEEAAETFFRDLLKSSEIGIDRRITFADYLATIGDRWTRGLDPTSTADGYKVGLRLRVLPALGHLPLSQITSGMIDRTIDDWEQVHSSSTIKNSIAPLVRVLDEAVRDDVLASNPARNRSRRSLGKSALIIPVEQTSPRAHALPDLATLNRLEATSSARRSTTTADTSTPTSSRARSAGCGSPTSSGPTFGASSTRSSRTGAARRPCAESSPSCRAHSPLPCETT